MGEPAAGGIEQLKRRVERVARNQNSRFTPSRRLPSELYALWDEERAMLGLAGAGGAGWARGRWRGIRRDFP